MSAESACRPPEASRAIIVISIRRKVQYKVRLEPFSDYALFVGRLKSGGDNVTGLKCGSFIGWLRIVARKACLLFGRL
jgi:hypothetical protein